jgi:hypothetical protein
MMGWFANARRRILRSHWESFGKLGDLKTWLISLAVTTAFLLLASLIFA